MQPATSYDDVRRLSEALRIRVPRGLPAAISAAARERHMTNAEWARQTLLRGLQAEGLVLRDGGAIERVEPEVAR